MKNLIYVIVCCMAVIPATAQLKVGANPTTISSGAILQADASGTRGAFYLPRVTLTSTADITTVASPQAGFTVYNTATAGTAPNNVTPGYYYYDGIQWQKILSSAAVNNNAWSVTGNSGTTPGTNFMGTTDDKDLVFKRNGAQAALLNSSMQNTSFGVNGLNPGTTGAYNTAVGAGVLISNSTGTQNMAIGSGTLYNNTTGSFNSATGINTMTGNTTGSYNTASGNQALYSNSTGNSNTAIGYSAGNNLTAGTNNLAVGATTNFALATGNNQMNIANNIFGTGLTGSVGSPAGNIGIGTSAPAATLDVNNGGSITTPALRLTTPFSGAATDSVLTWNATDNSVRKIKNTFAAQTKTLNFSAEYAGAIVTSNGLGAAGTIGSMTTVNDTTAAAYTNAYNWTSAETTTQSYNIILRVQVPADFKSWAPTTSFSVDFVTSATNATVGYSIKKSNGTAIGASITGLSGTSWSANTQNLSASSVVVAGDYLVVIFTLNSSNNGVAKIGDVRFNYISQ